MYFSPTIANAIKAAVDWKVMQNNWGENFIKILVEKPAGKKVLENLSRRCESVK